MLGYNILPAAAPRRSLARLRTVAVSVALAFGLLSVLASPVFAWSVDTFSASDESLLFSLTNQDRASAGLNVLLNDTYLHTEARWRSKDMADRNYFSHYIPPANTKVFADMSADGYCFKVAGENIGLSTWGDDVATNRIEKGFMGSPSHRDNILGSWTRMGIGAYKAADGRKLYTVLFSVPCGSVVPTPTPVKTAAPTSPNPTPVRTPAPTKTPARTPIPTARPVVTGSPAPTPARSASPSRTPSPSPVVTALPSRTPSPRPAVATASPTPRPTPTPSPRENTLSLRVYERPPSQGPIDSLFHSLFGRILGW
jgi:uncharacterized protein YkwD